MDEAWELEPCCTAALEAAHDVFKSTDASDTSEIDASPAAEALAHGAAAPALAQVVLGDGDWAEGHPRFRRFAQSIVDRVPPEQAAPARLLLALEAERRGQALEAEATLRTALADAPDYGPAALNLAGYEIDRGELGRALALLRHPGVSPNQDTIETLERLRWESQALYRGVGRNDRCPCGSGRKFKACCQRNPKVPDDQRLSLLSHKLFRFAGEEHRRSDLMGVASSMCDPDDPELRTTLASLVAHPLAFDLAVFDGGVAEDYLEVRGELLPAEERELLIQLLEEPRRLWEITGVDPGRGLTLRDTATGEVLELVEHHGAQEQEPGDLVLARVVRLAKGNRLVGLPMQVPRHLQDWAARLVASRPGADELAWWFGESIAFPRSGGEDEGRIFPG